MERKGVVLVTRHPGCGSLAAGTGRGFELQGWVTQASFDKAVLNEAP